MFTYNKEKECNDSHHNHHNGWNQKWPAPAYGVHHKMVHMGGKISKLIIYQKQFNKSRGVRRGVSGVSRNPPDSEYLPFYVLAMQTLLRNAEIIFNTV